MKRGRPNKIDFLQKAMVSEYGQRWFELPVIEQANYMNAFTSDLNKAIENIKTFKISNHEHR